MFDLLARVLGIDFSGRVIVFNSDISDEAAELVPRACITVVKPIEPQTLPPNVKFVAGESHRLASSDMGASVVFSDVSLIREGAVVEFPLLPFEEAKFGRLGPRSKIDAMQAELLSTSKQILPKVLAFECTTDQLDTINAHFAHRTFPSYRLMISATLTHGHTLLVFVLGPIYSTVRPCITVCEGKDDALSAWAGSDIKRMIWNMTIKPDLAKMMRPSHAIIKVRDSTVKIIETRRITKGEFDLRLVVHGRGNGLRFAAANELVASKLNSFLKTTYVRQHMVANAAVPRLKESMTARGLDELNYPVTELVNLAKSSGFTVDVDPMVHRWVNKQKKRVRRERTPFEQSVLEKGQWNELYSDGLTTQYEQLYNEKLKLIERRIHFPLHGFQKRDVARLSMKQNAVFAAFMGFGKAQPLHEKVLTPDGFVEMGSLAVGSKVIGSSGKAITITDIYPQGMKDVFEVVFSDGARVQCCEEHLWTVRSPQSKCQGGGWQVKSLAQLIAEGMRDRFGNLKHFVPLVEPIERPAVEQPLDPYLVGVLLGDGYIARPTPSITTADEEMLIEIQRLVPDGITAVKRGKYGYDLTDPTCSGNRLKDVLVELGLYGLKSATKYIPDVYMNGSIEQRLAVLQGLLDTDGSAVGYSADYTSISERMANQVVELARSLGGTAKILSRVTSFTHKSERKKGRRSWRVALRLPAHLPMFRLSRKASVSDECAGKPMPTRSIIGVEKVGSFDCQCIKVDATDSLYVTRDYVLTHNSRTALALTLLSGGKHNLIVLESRLIRELLKEAKNVGFPLEDFNVIQGPKDLKNLKRVNLISYNRLGQPVTDRKRVVKSERAVRVVSISLLDANGVESPFNVVRVRKVKGDKHNWWVTPEDIPPGMSLVDPKSAGPYKTMMTDSAHMEVVEDGDPTQVLAHLLRKIRFNRILFDEAHRLKGGMSTQQAKYSMLLRGKHVTLMTGTVVKNYPRNIYGLLVRAHGPHTPINPWSYTYDLDQKFEDGSRSLTTASRVFASKFVQIRYMSEEFKDSLNVGQKSREIPMVPERSLPEWQSMLSYMVLRRRKDEPEVMKDVHVPEGEMHYESRKATREHGAFYAWYLEKFAEWLAQALEDERSGVAFSSANLLVQLQLLMSAATWPQKPELQVPNVNTWQGGLTTKQQFIIEQITTAAEEGQKVILFASSPGFLEFMQEELLKKEIISLTFHGKIPMERRLAYLEQFQEDDGITALLMSRGSGQTGYNIECADAVISADFDWTPAAMEQSEARILRSKWFTEDRIAAGAKPQIYRVVQLDTIDEYMRQMIEVKTQGIGQAIDRTDVQFDWENDWKSYRQFSINMLKDLGYM